MTITEILRIIAAQIEYTDLSTTGPYGVYVTYKQIHSQPMHRAKNGDLLIFRYSSHTVRYGLNSKQWNSLELKVRKLQQEDLL